MTKAIGFYQSMGGEPVAHGIENFDQGRCRKLAFVWGAT